MVSKSIPSLLCGIRGVFLPKRFSGARPRNDFETLGSITLAKCARDSAAIDPSGYFVAVTSSVFYGFCIAHGVPSAPTVALARQSALLLPRKDQLQRVFGAFRRPLAGQ